MALTELTKITGPGIKTDTNWVGNNANYTGIVTASSFKGDGSQLTGVTSVGGTTGVSFDDNVKIKVGTHEDIEIYNKGNLSIIANKASGASSNNNPLHIFSHFDITHGSGFSQYFRVGNLVGQESAGAGDSALNLISGGAVQAFFNGTKRFETASTGVVVTGILTATSANFTGNVTIGGTLTYEDVTNIDSVGLITARNGLNVSGGNVSIAGVSTLGGSIQNSVKILHNSGYGLRVERGGKYIDFNGDWGASGSTALNAGSSGIRFYYGDSSDGIQFNTGSGADKVRITSDGKVGINSTSPHTKLDVIHSYVNRTWTPANSNTALFERNGINRIAIVAGASSQSQIDFADTNDDNAGYIRYDHSDNSMSFRTNGSGERLRINSSGNVGVGTDNVSTRLEIEGPTALTNHNQTLLIRDSVSDNATGRGGNIGFGAYVDGTMRSLAGIGALKSNSGTGFDGDLTLYTRRNGVGPLDERMRIKYNGKVGINTDNPSQMLTVRGSILKTRSDSGLGLIYLQNDVSNNGQIVINQNSGVTRTLLHSAGASYFNGGNVGIGSAIPAQKLDVDGIIRGSSYFQAGASGTASNNWHFGAEGNGDFRIYSGNYGAGNQKFKIDSSGNAIFGDVSAPYSSNSVTIHPADGMVNFGMDGRTSLVTSENSCYIFSGSGASGDMPAGSLVLQSRANVDRNIFFATGSTPSLKWQINGANGALRSYNYLPAGGYSTSTTNGYDIYLKLQGQVPTGTAGNAYTLFMTNTVGDAGAYILVIRSFEQSVTGGNLWSVRMVTSPFYVHSGSGNDGESVIIPYTYSGHANNATTQASNGQGPITLRIHFYNGSAHTNGRIRITFHGFNYTGTNCDWYLYKLIDV